ncbi:hypothetical protein NL676_019561 [Syzygium grande]|nr:hypothetical protein NL676_019561 [Syzygium grande]
MQRRRKNASRPQSAQLQPKMQKGRLLGQSIQPLAGTDGRAGRRGWVAVPEEDLRQVGSHLVLPLGAAVAFPRRSEPVAAGSGRAFSLGSSLMMEEEEEEEKEVRDARERAQLEKKSKEKRGEKKVEISEEWVSPAHVAIK